MLIINRSAIKMAEHDVFRDRTKHIDIKHHFLHQLVNDKIISLKWIDTKQQLADIFTKPLSPKIFLFHREQLLSPVSVTA